MNDETETVDVIDTIAYIEMHRQLMEREAGAEPARSEALRKLHEALSQEQALAQRDGRSSIHAANVDALAGEIQRVKSLRHGQGNVPSSPQPGPMRTSAARQNAPRGPTSRPRGRRTMGRHGSR